MKCKELDTLLVQYRDGLLKQAEHELVKQHLEHCSACRVKLQILEDCQSLYEEDEVPASFSAGWRQSIVREEEKPMKQTPKIIRWLAMAAAMFVLAGGTWLAGQQRRDNMVPSSTAQPYGGVSQLYSRSKTTGNESVMDAAPAAMGMAAELSMEESAEARVKIIRTARMELSTRTFEEDHKRILEQVSQLGGRVENTNLYNNASGLRTLYLTLRIPTARLDEMIAAAKGVGRLVSFSENAQDVSEQYADVAARLKTQQAKMERLQVLLSQAANVEDLIAIENSISDAQYLIDSLTGQLQGMDSRVDYATLDVSLNELSSLDASKDQEETLWQRIQSGAQAAWKGFVQILGDLAVFLAVALPYLVILAAAAVIIRFIVKRRKNS